MAVENVVKWDTLLENARKNLPTVSTVLNAAKVISHLTRHYWEMVVKIVYICNIVVTSL